MIIGLAINSIKIGYIFSTHQFYNGLSDHVEKGYSEYRVSIDNNYIAPGHYSIEIAAVNNLNVADYTIDNLMSFTILDAFL